MTRKCPPAHPATNRGGGTGAGRRPLRDSQGRPPVRQTYNLLPDHVEGLALVSGRTGKNVSELVRNYLTLGLLEDLADRNEKEPTMPTATLSSQAVRDKADRYLLAGQVRIEHVSADTFAGQVTGSRAYKPYPVTYVGGIWICGCPATVPCAHVVACQKVWSPADGS